MAIKDDVVQNENGNTPAAQGFLDDLGNWWNSVIGKDMSGADKAQNQFNSDEAQKSRDFEERMSNTAYQRQVADMKAAGINPSLAMANASSTGASTPAGATAQGSAVRGNQLNVGKIIGTAVKLAGSALSGKEATIAVSNAKDIAEMSQEGVKLDTPKGQGTQVAQNKYENLARTRAMMRFNGSRHIPGKRIANYAQQTAQRKIPTRDKNYTLSTNTTPYKYPNKTRQRRRIK